MDFKDVIYQLAERIGKQKDNITTEEATKNAFIMPLIAALGYDIFNPFEVVPELDCDLIKKKGEKIDYAIKKDDETILLIECKHCGQNLNLHDTQLQKYFVASNARFGVLTNGIEYRFYTDLEKPNIMDAKPFMVVNMLEITDNDIEQLKKFHKSYYDVDNILSTAQELKYTMEFRKLIAAEFENPSNEFVRYFAKPIYTGQLNQRVIDQFSPLVKKAIADLINETISERLGLAMTAKEMQINKPTEIEVIESAEQSPSSQKSLQEGVAFINEEKGIVTTQEEIDSYLIVKAILHPVVDVSRVFYRDAQSYFSILLDDNNRKPICRMYFNAKSVKYIALIDKDKKEIRHEIKTLDDIYNYSVQIRDTVSNYLK